MYATFAKSVPENLLRQIVLFFFFVYSNPIVFIFLSWLQTSKLVPGVKAYELITVSRS